MRFAWVSATRLRLAGGSRGIEDRGDRLGIELRSSPFDDLPALVARAIGRCDRAATAWPSAASMISIDRGCESLRRLALQTRRPTRRWQSRRAAARRASICAAAAARRQRAVQRDVDRRRATGSRGRRRSTRSGCRSTARRDRLAERRAGDRSAIIRSTSSAICRHVFCSTAASAAEIPPRRPARLG